MEGLICQACGDSGMRDLPSHDGMELYPCPVCHPWDAGFPGEMIRRGGRTIWIIEPSAPGQPAVYRGWNPVHED
jgi:hypothetical protein